MSKSGWFINSSQVSLYFTIPIGLLALLIITTNTLTLITFRSMKSLTLQQYLICCLAFADLLTGCVYLPHMIRLWSRNFWFTDEACIMVAVVQFSLIAETTYIHIALCLEKCYSILKPLKHRQFTQKFNPKLFSISLSVGVFIIVVACYIVLITSGFWQLTIDHELGACIFVTNRQYVIVAFMFTSVPLSIMVTTNVAILKELYKSGIQKKTRIRRALRVIVLTVGIFYLSFLPYSIWLILKATNISLPSELQIPAIQLVCANSTMNFFIYLYCFKDFRKQLQQIMRFKSSVYPIQ